MKLSHKLLISVLICTVLPLSVIIHELGHAITGTALGMGHNLAVAIICLIALLQSILTLKVLTTQFNGIKLRNQH